MAETNWEKVEPVCQQGVRGLCVKPYPNHPRGCPNYRKRKTCPPQAPLLDEIICLNGDVWAVWNRFPISVHFAKMRARHPAWTDRQVRNVLYWQGTARKELRGHIGRFRANHPELTIVTCPEANGVNLTATMANIDIMLEWPVMVWAYQIVLAGQPAMDANQIFALISG